MGQVFTLGTLHDARLRLRAPIVLEVDEDAGGVVVSYPAWNHEYAGGAHLTEAVARWQRAAVESYWWFKEHAGRLGPGLSPVWESMQAQIEERD